MTVKKKSGKTKSGKRRGSSQRGLTVHKKRRSVSAGSKSKRVRQTREPELPEQSTNLTSPDDQGLSRYASADSESVDELLDEGNAFEAGVVSGVERADNSDGKEVRTKEVPEDDVPGEYLDNDS